jgi:hypothetical protein
LKNRPSLNGNAQDHDHEAHGRRGDRPSFLSSDIRRAFKAVAASGGCIRRVSIDPTGRIEFTLLTSGDLDDEDLDLVEMAKRNG